MLCGTRRESLKKDFRRFSVLLLLSIHFILRHFTNPPHSLLFKRDNGPSHHHHTSYPFSSNITEVPIFFSPPHKQATPTKLPTKTRLSLKKTRKSKKDKTTPTSESPSTVKLMHLDNCRTFTPTKLVYALKRGEKEMKVSNGGTSPDVVEVVKWPSIKNYLHTGTSNFSILL